MGSLTAKESEPLISEPSLTIKKTEPLISETSLITKKTEPLSSEPSMTTKKTELLVSEPSLTTKKTESLITEPSLTTKKTEPSISEPSLKTKKIEESTSISKGAVQKDYSKSKKSKKSQKSSKKYNLFDTPTSEVSDVRESPWSTESYQSTPLYSEILSRNVKDSKELSVTTEDISLLDKIQSDKAIPKNQIDASQAVIKDSAVSAISNGEAVKPPDKRKQSTLPSFKY